MDEIDELIKREVEDREDELFEMEKDELVALYMGAQASRITTRAERDHLRDLFDRVKMEAQIHAGEARLQRSTVHRVIQEGKPGMGDWEDVPGMVAELRAERDRLADRLRRWMGAISTVAIHMDIGTYDDTPGLFCERTIAKFDRLVAVVGVVKQHVMRQWDQAGFSLVEQYKKWNDLTATPAQAKCEGYPADWSRLVLMVSPEGEIHAIGGDREPGEGDQPYAGLERLQRSHTLTLTNGTVVRAGDVLVWKEDHTKVRVTAIGEHAFLGRPFVGRTVVWSSEILCHEGQNWRPWSEVYPDRPVPGSEPECETCERVKNHNADRLRSLTHAIESAVWEDRQLLEQEEMVHMEYGAILDGTLAPESEGDDQ